MKKRKRSKLAELQLQASKGGVCGRCGKTTNLTVDHIIPSQFIRTLDSTGELIFEWEDNFQMLCYACNQFKANALDNLNPKTIPLLKELITKIEDNQRNSTVYDNDGKASL